ncbi:hypothetical protein Ddc_11246 [Ditylenchus destructor]|nr:hypothetical protein Ddc_11246 [Ditylenchus destructor]
MQLILLFVSALLLSLVHSSTIPVDESGLPDPDIINHELPTLRGPEATSGSVCEDQSIYCTKFHEMLEYQCDDRHFGDAIRKACPATCKGCTSDSGPREMNMEDSSEENQEFDASSGLDEGPVGINQRPRIPMSGNMFLESGEDEDGDQEPDRLEPGGGPLDDAIPMDDVPKTKRPDEAPPSADPDIGVDVLDEQNPLDEDLSDFGKSWTDQDEALADAKEKPAQGGDDADEEDDEPVKKPQWLKLDSLEEFEQRNRKKKQRDPDMSPWRNERIYRAPPQPHGGVESSGLDVSSEEKPVRGGGVPSRGGPSDKSVSDYGQGYVPVRHRAGLAPNSRPLRFY